MKIAIIGSGIAGNTLVWRMNAGHEVVVFEAGDHLGGHTHTHDVTVEGKTIQVDSGFIVFNEKTYPNFIDMLERLGVERQATEMSFSVHCERTGLEYAGTNLNSLFAQRKNLFSGKFYRLLMDIVRFNRRAPGFLNTEDTTTTLGEYLRDEGYSDNFLRYYILPMGAAIWSQDVESMLDFPARFFIRFFYNHGLLSISDRPQWYVVKGGSKTYVEKIYSQFGGEVKLRTPVTAVRRFADRVEVEHRHGRDQFDAVFFACHSDQALALLSDATEAERAVLGAIPYQANTAVLHLGDDEFPVLKRARSSWNYRIPARSNGAATVSYDMKKLQSLPVQSDIAVTLNSNRDLEQKNIIAQMAYDHPVFTLEGLRAQQRQGEINGVRRSFFCGAYWRYGFHEDGVVSALEALEHFNIWQQNYARQPLHRAG